MFKVKPQIKMQNGKIATVTLFQSRRTGDDFPKKLQLAFHQRWWEMYLTLGLRWLGLPVSTFRQDDRPDVLLNFGDAKVWIEAVAPKPGTKSDAVPEPVVNGVSDLPMRECLLRLTQAVTAKQKAHNCYLQRGIVSPADAFVIAVSAGALNQFGSLLEWPQPVMLRVLAGAGNLAIPLSESSAAYSKRQDAARRDSGSPVNLAFFYSNEFSSIKGVESLLDSYFTKPTAYGSASRYCSLAR